MTLFYTVLGRPSFTGNDTEEPLRTIKNSEHDFTLSFYRLDLPKPCLKYFNIFNIVKVVLKDFT